MLRGGGRRLPPPKPKTDWRRGLRLAGRISAVLAVVAIGALVVKFWRSPGRLFRWEPKPTSGTLQTVARITAPRGKSVDEITGPTYDYDVTLADGSAARITVASDYPVGTELRLLYATTSGKNLIVYSYVQAPSRTP